jgi:hypothetical protein
VSTEEIRALLDDASDGDVVVNYVDGTSVNCGSYREMLEQQLILSEYADKIIAEMNLNSPELYHE